MDLTVHELAQRAGASAHAVRYYTRIGLLRPDRHPLNRYKLFDHDDVHRLRFIRRAKEVGFTLNEIADILDDARQGRSPCPRARRILRQRIEDNRERIAELVELQGRMETALAAWERMPDGVPDGRTVCHLIESLRIPDGAEPRRTPGAPARPRAAGSSRADGGVSPREALAV